MSGALRESLRLTAGAAVLVALVAAGGCGTEEKPAARASHSPDSATTACRARWADLADQIEGNEKQAEPSALADRWNSVVATVDYYATSASSSDCEHRLGAQKQAIDRLESFGKSLRPWDMEYQLSTVASRAQDYASDMGSKGRKGKSKDARKQAGKDDLPSPSAVQKALAALRKQAPTATDDQGPGWQQAEVVDLAKKSAVKRARKDLDFLSHQSKAWRACDDALRTIRKALRSGR